MCERKREHARAKKRVHIEHNHSHQSTGEQTTATNEQISKPFNKRNVK